MAHIDPAAPENLRHFLAQDVLGHQDLAVQEEGLFLAIVDNVGTDGHFSQLSGADPLYDVLAYRLGQNPVKFDCDISGPCGSSMPPDMSSLHRARAGTTRL